MGFFRRKSKKEEAATPSPEAVRPSLEDDPPLTEAAIFRPRSTTVRLLGMEGVGKSTLLQELAKHAAGQGESRSTEGGYILDWKGDTITILETHFSQLQEEPVPQADVWYLVVELDEGPADLDQVLNDVAGLPLRGVFMNKCDCVDDDELIELCEMETRAYLDESGISSDDLLFIAGSAYDAAEAYGPTGTSALEALLDDILR